MNKNCRHCFKKSRCLLGHDSNYESLQMNFDLSGYKTPTLLHEKLEAAKVKGDSDELERVIDECLLSGQPEIVPEVVKARELFACRQDYPRG